jgi:hypothetical protein
MLEIVQNFEQIAVRFNPALLAGAGLAAVLTGLLIWLAGMGFRRLLAAIAGAITGGICGFFTTSRNVMSVGIFAAVGASVAALFEKVFMVLLAAALAAALAFAIMGKIYIKESGAAPINHTDAQNQAEPFSFSQTQETLKTCAADFYAKIKQAGSQMPTVNWAITAGAGIILLVAGSFSWRLAAALCCATLGTILIFTGMTLLLLYKHAAPISCICSNRPFYLGVFAAMIAFGTIEQLFLCQCVKKCFTRKNQTNKTEHQHKEQTQGWRNK